jgi:hypothetical protein
MSGSCRNPKTEPRAFANMIRYALEDTTVKMTKPKLKRMHRKVTGKELTDQEAEQALRENTDEQETTT